MDNLIWQKLVLRALARILRCILDIGNHVRWTGDDEKTEKLILDLETFDG